MLLCNKILCAKFFIKLVISFREATESTVRPDCLEQKEMRDSWGYLGLLDQLDFGERRYK